MAYPSFSGLSAPVAKDGTLDTTGATVALADKTDTVSVYTAAAAYYRYDSSSSWMPIPATTWITLPVGAGAARISSIDLKADSGTPAVYIDCSPFPRS